MNGEHHQLQESPVSPGSSGFVNSSSPVPIEAVKHQRQRDEKEDFGSALVPSVSVVDPGSSSRPVLNQSGLRKRKKKKKSVLQVHQSKKTKTKMNFKCTKCSHSVALPRQKEDLEKLQLALDTRKRQVDETAASGMAFPTSSESDEDSDAEIPLLNNNNSYQHSAAAHALKNDATSSYNSVSSPSSSSTKGDTTTVSISEMDAFHHPHCHSYRSSAAEKKSEISDAASKKLLTAVFLCFLFTVGEIIGGYLSNSLAILSDAAHMTSDFLSLFFGLCAIRISKMVPGKRMTFGYQRAEALGALATVALVWYVTGVLVYIAIHRMNSGEFEVESTAMVIVAGAAVLFNVILSFVLQGVPAIGHGHSHGGGGHGHSHSHRSSDRNHLFEEDDERESNTKSKSVSALASQHLNIRAASLHVLGDLLSSIGVLISSVIIKFYPEAKIADPICTCVFAVIVFFTTLSVLRDAALILMEAVPRDIKYDDVFTDLNAIEGVKVAHELHIWSIANDRKALSCHLAIDATADPDSVVLAATKVAKADYGVDLTSIQVERYKPHVMGACQDCMPL